MCAEGGNGEGPRGALVALHGRNKRTGALRASCLCLLSPWTKGDEGLQNMPAQFGGPFLLPPFFEPRQKVLFLSSKWPVKEVPSQLARLVKTVSYICHSYTLTLFLCPSLSFSLFPWLCPFLAAPPPSLCLPFSPLFPIALLLLFWSYFSESSRICLFAVANLCLSALAAF